MPTEVDHNRAGLNKLMLKMPALRGQLQILSAQNPELYNLCGAFGDASATLERLRRNQTNPDSAVIADYENLCVELEQDIIRICLAKSRSDFAGQPQDHEFNPNVQNYTFSPDRLHLCARHFLWLD